MSHFSLNQAAFMKCLLPLGRREVVVRARHAVRRIAHKIHEPQRNRASTPDCVVLDRDAVPGDARGLLQQRHGLRGMVQDVAQ